MVDDDGAGWCCCHSLSCLLSTTMLSYCFTALRHISRPSCVALRCSSTFQYEKSKDLFERITATCTKEDMSLLADAIGNILGRFPRQNEFYYSSFSGKAATESGSVEEVKEEAKTAFDLKLVGFDAKAKIKVIKEVRSIAGLGLKEAKELVESAPKVLMKELKPEQAEELKKQLEEIGAQIELV